MNKKLPVSLKVIGWFYMLISVFISLVGIISALLVLINSVRILSMDILPSFMMLLLLTVIGVGMFFVGKGILALNKTAWIFGLLLAFLSLLGILSGRDSRIYLQTVVDIFVIWKLWEHRKLFGIN